MMGITDSRIHPKSLFPERGLLNVDDDNGFFVLSQLELNDDVLRMILSHVPSDDVFNCRLVCKNWCNIIDTEVWKDKISKIPELNHNTTIRNLPWHLQYWILKKKILHRNLVKNFNGEEELLNWKILSNGGNHWKIEKPPSGTDNDSQHPSCFVTSFGLCSKEQIIDLYREGAKQQLMDDVKPEITISEWYSGRWDCKATYDIEVNLVNEAGDIIDEFRTKQKCGGDYGNEWRQVTHTFRNYGEGVRYVRFYHSGVDNQFWAGHYGSKMTGSSVILAIL